MFFIAAAVQAVGGVIFVGLVDLREQDFDGVLLDARLDEAGREGCGGPEWIPQARADGRVEALLVNEEPTAASATAVR